MNCDACKQGGAAALARFLQTALDRGTWPAAFIALSGEDKETIIHALHAYGHGGHATPISQPIADLAEPAGEKLLEQAIHEIERLRVEAQIPASNEYNDGVIDGLQQAQTALANLPVPKAA